MKRFILVAVMLFSVSSFAAEECYQVTAVEDSWSKTPELLCVDGDVDSNLFILTLKTGLLNQTTVATFNLNLLSRAKCMDCNKDVFGLSNPSNSSFNALAIEFDGTRDIFTMKEKGTVSIGATRFFYRSL